MRPGKSLYMHFRTFIAGDVCIYCNLYAHCLSRASTFLDIIYTETSLLLFFFFFFNKDDVAAYPLHEYYVTQINFPYLCFR